ncbi:MAG TPA: hypothetical protein VHV75_10460 [Solirubrobacteraceae bacterium]|jgi:hypothetical protein|nr:hypothetical protein [Solirubrobacteraceae bacterium]
MATAIRLNDKQVAVLRWIAEGCPEGVMTDDSHRISAAALRTRGLAITSGHGPSWTAEVTPAGHAYLARLGAEEPARVGESPASGPAAGCEIDLPAKVRRHHPVANDFRDRLERHEVSRAQLARATQIVQTLVTEAELRGWSVRTATESDNEVGLVDWSSAKDGHFQITAGQSSFWLRLQEEGVRTRDVLADEDSLEAYDSDGAGRLKLELRWGEWFTRKQSRWADRSTVLLEDRLVDVLDEIEERTAEAERAEYDRRERAALAEADAQARAQAREAEWIRLMGAARERHLEERRAAALLEQVERFEQAARIRAYCDAVAAPRRDRDPSVVAWVEWARAHADRLDPLAGAGPREPEDLEPAPAMLQAYLPEGWSAAGP